MSELSDRLDQQARDFKRRAYDRKAEADHIIFIDTRPTQHADAPIRITWQMVAGFLIIALCGAWYLGWVMSQSESVMR